MSDEPCIDQEMIALIAPISGADVATTALVVRDKLNNISAATQKAIVSNASGASYSRISHSFTTTNVP